MRKIRRNNCLIATFYITIQILFILQAIRCEQGLRELSDLRFNIFLYVIIDMVMYFLQIFHYLYGTRYATLINHKNLQKYGYALFIIANFFAFWAFG